MMGVFAAAVARLTPSFVESFDPEKLASKFVRVEKEFGVKFTKSNSTFNIVGHWEAVRKAHKSLLKLKFNEKVTENSSESVDIKADISGTKITPLSKSGNVPDEYNNVEVPQTSETEQITEKEPLLVRGKGNPKRGRHAAKESPYSGVPEPVFYLQYQDKTFADACSLDIDSVLEDFEKSHNNTKVTKEELKKILEKNKDQMGKPLEKGIPKGAILPVAKVTEDNCETFAVEDMLNPIPPSTRMPSDVPQGYGYGMQGCSKENTISFMSNGQPLLCSSGAMNMEMANQFNTSMVTTYTVNSKMTTQSPGLVPCINEAINQNSTTSGHLNVSDFYNHTDVKNGRVHVNEAVFSENQYNVNNTRPVQLSDSDSDSFSSMFGDYDPQAMLNQIPASEMMGNITEVPDKRLQEVDTKLSRNDKELQGETVSNNDNESKQRNFQNSEELETSFNPPEVANDRIPCESNGIKMEMHDFKDGTASFEDFTDLPVGSKTFTAKDFSRIVLHEIVKITLL
ncbi:uncharacterized protein LOC132738804 [Ruditapes philippinarum]|uniref:uncharacterized protein LOC132738804 n=1 Tax=Ruditapes philippinarum TaxID=129788 RepID=UPI00295B1D87|nr:uncharacterized protein LOC132738804 [Ruditapes philippinarum]